MPAAARADEDFLAELRAELDRASARSRDSTPPVPVRFAVALSGGLDSSVLLAGLARLDPRPIFRALHVDHALHPDSAAWDAHCAAFSAALGVPYRSARVEVDRSLGIGLEAAAREARYAALAELLEPGEILLTAHHADDVLETIMHRIVRGTGIRGLRGVLPRARLGRGFVVRPLLGFERAELRVVAERWGIGWLEDPSNRSLDYDRNYLRAEVLPALKRRWPRACQAAARLAAAAGDAEEILEAAAAADLARAGSTEARPSVAALAQLSPARRRNALRHAIACADLPMPSARQLETLAASLIGAREDASTRVSWPGAEARIYRGRLHLLRSAAAATPRGRLDPGRRAARPAVPAVLPASHATLRSAPREAPPDSPVPAPPDPPVPAPPDPQAHGPLLLLDAPWIGPAGRLTLEPLAAADTPIVAEGADGDAAAPPVLPDAVARDGLEVRFRRGGERFKPAGSAHHRKLKHWFQEQGIVPWMRDRIPLLYWRGRLVAIADLAIAADLPAPVRGEGGWRVRWDEHSEIR
jgi:tRNA(Ile)-lysidine synthase